MKQRPISNLQLMCQYQIPALLGGTSSSRVFNQAYINACRGHAQTLPKSTSRIPRGFFRELDEATRSVPRYEVLV